MLIVHFDNVYFFAKRLNVQVMSSRKRQREGFLPSLYVLHHTLSFLTMHHQWLSQSTVQYSTIQYKSLNSVYYIGSHLARWPPPCWCAACWCARPRWATRSTARLTSWPRTASAPWWGWRWCRPRSFSPPSPRRCSCPPPSPAGRPQPPGRPGGRTQATGTGHTASGEAEARGQAGWWWLLCSVTPLTPASRGQSPAVWRPPGGAWWGVTSTGGSRAPYTESHTLPTTMDIDPGLHIQLSNRFRHYKEADTNFDILCKYFVIHYNYHDSFIKSSLHNSKLSTITFIDKF